MFSLEQPWRFDENCIWEHVFSFFAIYVLILVKVHLMANFLSNLNELLQWNYVKWLYWDPSLCVRNQADNYIKNYPICLWLQTCNSAHISSEAPTHRSDFDQISKDAEKRRCRKYFNQNQLLSLDKIHQS